MTDLFELVLHRIEGTDTETQNWQTDAGIKTVEFQSFGPDRWIERAALGRLMAIDLLAVILFALRDTFDLEQERRIVDGWAVELRKAASAGEIQARDPVTLLALETLPDGWEWLVSMADADKFIAARGMGWTPSERVTYLLEQCRNAGTRYLDPKTGQLLNHYWLAGYEPKQAAPATDTATPAPVVAASDGPAPVDTGEGLTTKAIAAIFDGLMGWDDERWTKNLSASQWLHPARTALGGAGVASSVWNPLTLAQLMHEKRKGLKPKEQLMKALHSRFNRNSALVPWCDDFNEYFATFCTTD